MVSDRLDAHRHSYAHAQPGTARDLSDLELHTPAPSTCLPIDAQSGKLFFNGDLERDRGIKRLTVICRTGWDRSWRQLGERAQAERAQEVRGRGQE